MRDKSQVQDAIKSFILQQFLPGEDPNDLTPTTPLISAGILDSIGTLQLVTFLEETFGIMVAAHEADVEHLNTLEDISALVISKS